MSNRIPESELILREGRIYHLNLRPDMIADKVIVVGDPERVPKVSAYFDKIDVQVSSREFVTHTGTIGGTPISVISSGMGTDNVEILMTELDALVNIDFETRQIRAEHRSLEIYRIGTSGCLQADIPLDAHLVSNAALGLDTLMNYYQLDVAEGNVTFVDQVRKDLGLTFTPYFVNASNLSSKFSDFHQGVTLTAPGFYAPQGREVRLKPRIDGLVDRLAAMVSPAGRFTNLEMETAGYYAMGSLLGHQVVSLNALIANRARQEFSNDPESAIDGLIRKVLERI